MTSQTKKFIELSDIIGLRFECRNKKCGASLNVPLLEALDRNDPIQKCPVCHGDWARVGDIHGHGGTNYDVYVVELLNCLRKMQDAPTGFALTLELKQEITVRETA